MDQSAWCLSWLVARDAPWGLCSVRQTWRGALVAGRTIWLTMNGPLDAVLGSALLGAGRGLVSLGREYSLHACATSEPPVYSYRRTLLEPGYIYFGSFFEKLSPGTDFYPACLAQWSYCGQHHNLKAQTSSFIYHHHRPTASSHSTDNLIHHHRLTASSQSTDILTHQLRSTSTVPTINSMIP